MIAEEVQQEIYTVGRWAPLLAKAMVIRSTFWGCLRAALAGCTL